MSETTGFTQLTIADFTTEVVSGTGAFDVMMRSVQEQVGREYTSGRIKGTEYATVYLGALNSTMDRSLQFLLSKDEVALKATLIEVEVEKAILEKAQISAQTALIQKQTEKLTADINLTTAQIATANAEKLLVESQTAKSAAELVVMTAQKDKIRAEISLIGEQADAIGADIALATANAGLVGQKELNAVVEKTVLAAQECKLRSEYDLILQQKLKSIQETALMESKVQTENNQHTNTPAAGSVLGTQLALYTAQKDGFKRDAENKAAKLMIDTWAVRQTTDGATTGTGQNDNGLGDSNIGKAVNALLNGVGANT